MTLDTYAIHRPMAQGEAWEVRRWRVVNAHEPVLVSTTTFGTYGEARASVPPGLASYARAATDEPDLVEVWL